MHPLGRQVGEEGRGEAERVLDQRLVEAPADERDGAGHDQADDQPAGDRQGEESGRPGGREVPADHRGGRHLVEHQRGRIVEQPLALDHRLQARRHPDPAADGDGRDGVRRSHDRAERERRRPGQVGDDEVRDRADHRRGEHHEADRQQHDRAQIGAERDEARVQRRAVEQRRQHEDEHDLRIQLDRRLARQRGDSEPAEDEQHRRGHPRAAGGEPREAGPEHHEEHGAELVHGPPPAARTLAGRHPRSGPRG